MEHKTKKLLTLGLGIFVGISILSYSLWRTKDLMGGPQLIVTYPRNGSTIENALLTIRGEAKHVAGFTLNGRTIYADQSGRWEETILLSYGYNLLTVRGKDRFGRTIEKSIELIYK